MLVTDVCCFLNGGCIFNINIFIQCSSIKEDTEASDSDKNVGESDPEPAVSSTAFAHPRGPSGRSTYLKLTS